ncbi:hypothetical protein ACGE24_03575 [Corynebacterium kroppenstedtii]|uniref:hypothetical protein n=1 Tax=Corynebacterium sp. PCR 32 TaxID=3351342 RepID=UPI00309F29C4
MNSITMVLAAEPIDNPPTGLSWKEMLLVTIPVLIPPVGKLLLGILIPFGFVRKTEKIDEIARGILSQGKGYSSLKDELMLLRLWNEKKRLQAIRVNIYTLKLWSIVGWILYALLAISPYVAMYIFSEHISICNLVIICFIIVVVILICIYYRFENDEDVLRVIFNHSYNPNEDGKKVKGRKLRKSKKRHRREWRNCVNADEMVALVNSFQRECWEGGYRRFLNGVEKKVDKSQFPNRLLTDDGWEYMKKMFDIDETRRA